MLQKWLRFVNGWAGWSGIVVVGLVIGLLAFLIDMIAEPRSPIGRHALMGAVMGLAQIGLGAAIKGSFGDLGRKKG